MLGGVNQSWRMAVTATRHCLTGCAIGEVLGMVIGAVAGLTNGVTVVLVIVLAFVFGYALIVRATLRAGLTLTAAFRVALAADTVSIAVMELVDNAFILAVPGAMTAGLASWLFWVTLVASLAVAFVVTLPVNRALIARGLGHAAIHGIHGPHDTRATYGRDGRPRRRAGPSHPQLTPARPADGAVRARSAWPSGSVAGLSALIFRRLPWPPRAQRLALDLRRPGSWSASPAC